MKLLLKIFPVLLFVFISCEDVIDVTLNEGEIRLVIEANILVNRENGETSSYVRLTTTGPYFNNEVPVVDNATVEIIEDADVVHVFEYQDNGIYVGELYPQLNKIYELRIHYNNETYTATTQLFETSHLENVEQNNEGGFFSDAIELKVFFQDPADVRNFYYFTAVSEKGIRRDVLEDGFFDGNKIFGLYRADDLAPGDEVKFTLAGVSEQFYNYMFTLIQQTGNGGGPFETQPATVRGNIINTTDPENYPLGFFRISEISNLQYVVQ